MNKNLLWFLQTLIIGLGVVGGCYMAARISVFIEEHDLEWLYVAIPVAFILGLIVRYLFNI